MAFIHVGTGEIAFIHVGTGGNGIYFMWEQGEMAFIHVGTGGIGIYIRGEGVGTSIPEKPICPGLLDPKFSSTSTHTGHKHFKNTIETCIHDIDTYPTGEKRRLTSDQWRSWNVRKSNAHQRETTVTSSDLHQLCSLTKLELLLKERIAPRGSEFFPLRSVPYGMEITFATLGDHP